MPNPLYAFGHGVPLTTPGPTPRAIRDITRIARVQPRRESSISDFIESFMDPFVRSFLLNLEAGVYDDGEGILIWRAAPGAIHAYRYAQQFRRIGFLPNAPALELWNRASGNSSQSARFNASEDARIGRLFAGAPEDCLSRKDALAILDTLQAQGRVSGTDAFLRRLEARQCGGIVELTQTDPRGGPRLALAGAPLGNPALHRWLEAQGTLVLDLQGPDHPEGDLRDLLHERHVETLFWQVDPHDDLHGWKKPHVQSTCEASGVRFADLGFIPTWPSSADLPRTT